MGKIILLKNKTVPEDPYDLIFKEHGYQPLFLPLLKHTSVNEGAILEFIKSEEFLTEYKALIITSQRCIETLDTILRILREEGFDKLDGILNKPSYTVGPATSQVLKRLGFTNIRGGDKAGNGSILSDLIIDDLLLEADRTKKVLFLTGEIHKDVIPRKLRLANFSMKELISYRTEPLEDIASRYLRILDGVNFREDNWIVFFSPQGTQNIVEYLKEHRGNFKVASIGPTTEIYLENNQMKAEVVSRKPNATELVRSIEE
ncbi:hypothetical protein FOA43_002455 [Brettanomyces nanus]|uniref:Tetrapyrrole biosynthesis uroporphyrinogen III synthase domain-containing protein n=1 Tax=Eeniella nana TaxID=13502 RepID=A0A875S7G9_EENNA|nr:uncharacterized protein FOA43_002455 [Brettanomyces nanus]QPG75114.1 hypothetical protein FOA43_002455 [Brettanomyces nanus]